MAPCATLKSYCVQQASMRTPPEMKLSPAEFISVTNKHISPDRYSKRLSAYISRNSCSIPPAILTNRSCCAYASGASADINMHYYDSAQNAKAEVRMGLGLRGAD